jgi:hypothetical protein
MNEYLDSYKQIADGHPDDSYEPGTNKQRIDLTEYYKETKQDDATMMVSGIEAMNLGKFSKRVAGYFKLAGFESYDPFPSERNARAGQEGFFATLKNGFKTFIENIIKYIRMAVDWVVDTVRGIFGFRKSARINKAINDSLDDLKKEFVTVLSGLGFPAAEYNLENFLQNLPPNQDRVAQLILLKSKFETDQGSIDALGEALPLLQQCIAKLKNSSDRVTQASSSLKITISKEHTKVRARGHLNENWGQPTPDLPAEVNRVMKAILDVSTGLDAVGLATEVSKLYNLLYGINFSNDELMTGFSNVRKRIQETVATETVKLGKQDIPVLLTSIQFLNMRYIEVTSDDLDLSKINFKNLGNTVDKTDAEKVGFIADFYENPALVQMYQQMTVDVRNFSQFCYSVSSSLMVVEKQITNLVEWYNRAHAFYYHGLLEDMEEVAKINREARAAGHTPYANAAGYPREFVFIKDADAQTFAEKAGAVSETIISNDFGGVKTTFNNFAKQTGWGKLV